MSKYSEQSEARKQAIRDSARRNQLMHRAKPPLEAAVWKLRTELACGADPYTPDERTEAVTLRAQIDVIEAKAEALKQRVARRLESEGTEDAKKILETLETAKELQVKFMF